MSSLRHLPRLAVLGALAGALATPASAADVTAEQAATLQTQLHDWVGALGSPAANMTAQPVKVTADGDHFKVEILPPPEMVQQGVMPDATMATLTARPIDGGRYEFDTLMVPSPFTITLPATTSAALQSAMAGTTPPARPGQPPPPPTKAAADTAPIKVVATLKDQTFHGVLDPSLATVSTFDSAISDVHLTVMTVVADIAKMTGHSTYSPAGGGRLNVAGETGFDDITVTGTGKANMPFAITVKGGKLSSRIDGELPGSSGAINTQLAALNAVLKHEGPTPITPEQRRAAHDAVQAIGNSFTSQASTMSLDGVKVGVAGQTTDIGHTAFSGRLGTEAGRVVIGGGVTIENIASTAIPPGVYHDMTPQRFVLNSRIYGISRDDLMALVNHAIDDDMKNPAQSTSLQTEGLAMLAKGPLGIAVDQLVLDIPGASLKGAATMEIASPTDITAHALLTMDGLDALIKKANTTPELQKAAPGLIFLKGIGAAEGNTTTWKVSYVDRKIMVNDTDLSAMMPGNAPHP